MSRLLLEGPAWHPQHMPQVDHRQTGATIGLPPLSCHGVGLGAPDPQQRTRLLHGQQQGKSFTRHKV